MYRSLTAMVEDLLHCKGKTAEQNGLGMKKKWKNGVLIFSEMPQ